MPAVRSPILSQMPASAARPDPSVGGRLVAADGRELAFVGCSLEVDAKAGLARVTLRQSFRNNFDVPLQVTYQVPLPADAAVGGYTFHVAGKRIVGEIDRREVARRRFEDAILEGRSAALLDQERSSVFTQQIGNIPPHAEVVCELVIDQRLLWLAEGAWEWRFPTVIAPRYLGASGRVQDAGAVSVDVAESGIAARARLRLLVGDRTVPESVTSPTHSVTTRADGEHLTVCFASEEGSRLDRDIAIRWLAAAQNIGVTLDLARPGPAHAHADSAFGLLTIVPPAHIAPETTVPRDVIVLLDTSGSMTGEPLTLAKDLATRIVASLGPLDTLEMVEFSNQPSRWQPRPVAGTEFTRHDPAAWIRALRAGGGTEMESGVLEALRPARDRAQRQVILITDGLVGFEADVIRAVRAGASAGCRLHTVGIGPASNRSLTAAVARAGRGGEFLVGLGEDAAAAAGRIIARTKSPLLTDLRISGSALVELPGDALPDLLAGSPALIPVRLKAGGGELVVRSRTPSGEWTSSLDVPPSAHALGSDALPRLFARESVEELECQSSCGASVDERIERLGLDYQISTRRTSWIAVSEEPTVDPGAPIKRVRIPQELPVGLSAEGLGLRGPGFPMLSATCPPSSTVPMVECDMTDFDPDESVGAECASFDRLDQPLHLEPTRAELVSLADGRAIIEIVLTDAVNWHPRRIDIDGVRQCSIGREGTTKPGRYRAGDRIRILVHRLPRGLTPASLSSATVHMTSGRPPMLLRFSHA